MDFKERFKGRTTVMDKEGMLGILKGSTGEPVNKSAIRAEARMALKSKEYQQPPNEVPNYPQQQPPKFQTMNIASRNASSTKKLPSMIVQNSYYSAQSNGGDRSPKFAGSDPSYNQQGFEYEASTPVHRGMKGNGSQKALMSSGGYFLPNVGSRDNNHLQESTSGYMEFNNGQSLKRNDSLFRRTPDLYPTRGPGDFAGVQPPQSHQSQGRNVLLHNSSNILRNLDTRFDYDANNGGNTHGTQSPSYGMRSHASLAKSYISHLSHDMGGNDQYQKEQLVQSHHWGNGSPQVLRPMMAPDSFKSFEPLTPMNKPNVHVPRLTNAYSSSEIPKVPLRMKTKA